MKNFLAAPSVTFLCNFQGVRSFVCQVDTQSLHTRSEYVLPVESCNVEVKQLLIERTHPAPYCLHIVICKLPFLSAEVRNYINKLVDLLVSCPQPETDDKLLKSADFNGIYATHH